MDIIKLVISLAVCLLAGIIGSIFTRKSIPAWYSHLKKPKANPPNWIFAPVWTVLYILMGISIYLVWESGHITTLAIIIFIVQLVLNVLWSVVFFGTRSLFGGLWTIILLWIAILDTILVFLTISYAAAIFLLPYILWVSFAAYLNYRIWILNA